ncbi:MAG: hypothetical protein AAGJ87_09335, partial [Pseudomonadota bacterium]
MKNRLWAKASAFALCAALAAPHAALAQDDDVIIVTGSFIKKRSQADLPSPLLSVGAEDIKDI